MRINPILNSNKALKTLGVAVVMLTLPAVAKTYNTSFNNDRDVFVLTQKEPQITPSGTQDIAILKAAPSPSCTVKGEKITATIVVDLSKNVLYKYDDKGNATDAYSVCSGKPSTPTHTGIRYITHIENYPYKTAPINSKRRRHPNDYGPKIICLDRVDVNTGARSPIGEFIHGNKNPDSIGKYYSHGCIRMDNEVIKKLSAEVKSGQYVKIIK